MKIRYIKRAIIWGIILSVCFLTGCRSDDISDQVSNVIQASDENILGVKNSCPNAYPDITWGEAFESFFSKPTWKYFVGTVEASPSLDDVLEKVKAGNYKKVVLEPLMVVAGDHANNDMAGDEDDSWKKTFENAGYEVTCLVRGLGENEDIRQIYVDHAKAAIDSIK